MPPNIKVDLLNAETITFFDREFIVPVERDEARLAWQAIDGMEYRIFRRIHKAAPTNADPPTGYDSFLIHFAFDPNQPSATAQIRIGIQKNGELVIPLKKF